MKIKLMFAAVMLVSCNIPHPKKYLVHFKNTLTHAATTRMEYQDPPRYVVGDTVELSSGFRRQEARHRLRRLRKRSSQHADHRKALA